MQPIDLRQIAENAMNARGLRPAFSPAALQEATARPPRNRPDEVRDLRGLPWFAIDNHDTLDVDQLSIAETLPGGRLRVRVAIADVDARVMPSGAVEAHAPATLKLFRLSVADDDVIWPYEWEEGDAPEVRRRLAERGICFQFALENMDAVEWHGGVDG